MTDAEIAAEVQRQLASSSDRPRLTGLLRAQLYPQDLVVFDIEQESINRYSSLACKQRDGNSRNGTATGSPTFSLSRFAPNSATDREKVSAREAYNQFLSQCNKVMGEGVDRQSVAEFIYGALSDESQDMEAQYEAIQEVLGNFNRSMLGQFRHTVEKLKPFDRGTNPGPSRRRDFSVVDRNMDSTYGSDMDFKYPLDYPLIPPTRAVSSTAAPRDSAEDSRERFIVSTKALVTGNKNNSASSSSKVAPKKMKASNLVWLRDQCEVQLVQLAENGGCALTVEELMAQILDALESKGEIEMQEALCELLGFEAFEIISNVIGRRQDLVDEWKEIRQEATKLLSESGGSRRAADPAPKRGGRTVGPSITVMSQREKNEAKAQLKADRKAAQGKSADEDAQHVNLTALRLLSSIDTGGEAPDEWSLQGNSNLAPASTKTANPHVHQSHYTGMGLKLTLPEGTIRKTEQGCEKVCIPASTPFDPKSKGVKHIKFTEMPEWARTSFKSELRGKKMEEGELNTIQSIVFNAAFGRSQNLLICAPTGAGKTNIAVLTILRLIGQHMDAAGGVGRDFKVIYMAPMKALVAEVVEKFQKRLGPLGIQVAEMTGDMNLSAKERESVHVIVTVPEKWDVLTRNTKATGGANDDDLQKLVQLIIIDEVHLLNEDRGAIIETVVARSKRYQEMTGQPVRIVALSATLPNYQDVANFLGVDGENLFYFDSSYRPIPLETTFLGVTESNVLRRLQKFNEVCYEQVLEQVKGGHQCMVFVHARQETVKTAKALGQMAQDGNEMGFFDASEESKYAQYRQEVGKSRDRNLQTLFEMGFGCHHAGMLRADRTLTEKMFCDGVIRVLCCTSTLAWGVNLPARTVIIKGTSIFASEAGGFKDLGILDVQQIFGRAGRPGFDTRGSAMLITTHDKLNHYLRQLLHQTPIESKFTENMANALNAEIAMGAITSEKEASDWLSYTYLYVRFYRTPTQFGITQQDLQEDPLLDRKRRDLCNDSAMSLNKARLIRVDNNKNYNATDLGRVAARFYVDWETAEMFSTGAVKGMTDDKILALFGKAAEFKQLKVRDDEIQELERMMGDENVCPVRVLGGATNVYGKVAILLQGYLSRVQVETSSLVSDCNYVLANASRLFRTMFEITMTRVTNMSELSDRLLEWCKMVDWRLWQSQHTLRHFCYPPPLMNNKTKGMSLDAGPQGGVLKEQTVWKLEEAGFDYWHLQSMQVFEIANITGSKANATAVEKYVRRVPNLELNAKIQPITSTIMRITLTLTPNFDWSDRWSGPSEPFYVWVENPESQDILHSEQYILHKRNLYDKGQLSFAIPLQEPRPPQYIIKVVSDRWVGVQFNHEFSVSHLLLPDRQSAHTRLLDLTPLPVSALHNASFERLYRFTHFNAIQTQVFHTCYHTDYNVLLGAPTGSGKTNVAELCMFRVFNNMPDQKIIYVAPLKALARERMEDWEERFQRQLGKTVIELTGDFTPDVEALDRADVVVTTPEKWDGISRHWHHRSYVRNVALIIIDEIHLLGQDRGPVLEVIVSRMRYISCTLDKPIRFCGLSTALANAKDIADWLGIGNVGLFNFKPSVRPVPMTAHIQGYPEKQFVPRMASMNKPCYHAILNHAVKPEGIKPTLVFVSSRRQTRLTGLDIIAFMQADPDADLKRFCKMKLTKLNTQFGV